MRPRRRHARRRSPTPQAGARDPAPRRHEVELEEFDVVPALAEVATHRPTEGAGVVAHEPLDPAELRIADGKGAGPARPVGRVSLGYEGADGGEGGVPRRGGGALLLLLLVVIVVIVVVVVIIFVDDGAVVVARRRRLRGHYYGI